MASRIRSFTGGDIFEIVTMEAYNGNTVVSVGREQVRAKNTPALRNHLANTDYDVIFIGSPIWWYSIAPPVLTFVRETQLAGKIIVPFCTHDGNYGRYFDRMLRNVLALQYSQAGISKTPKQQIIRS
jgi:flavodoxin